jgi:uncharacterized protein (DUF58 family)
VTSLAPDTQIAAARFTGKIPFAFGSRFFIALLIGLVWTIPAWWSPRFITVMFLWDAAVLAAWLNDFLRLPPPAQLGIQRLWTEPLILGRRSAATIEISNRSRAPLYISLVEGLPHSLCRQPESPLIAVPAAASARHDYTVVPVTRGDIAVSDLYLRYRSTLGLAERWATAGLSQTVRVFPDLVQAGHDALYLIRSRQIELEKRRKRQRGQGRDFESLREYRRGDEMRTICWTATARRNQLTTRVFQVERSQTVWIVVDAGRLLRAEVRDVNRANPAQKLDYAVDAALSLAQVASQSGDRVAVLAYGREIQQLIGAGRGPLHLRAILDALAQVHGEASEANHARAVRMLLHRQSRRALIVWLTDFAETPTTPEVVEYAMHLTSRHLMVFAAIAQPDLTNLAAEVPQNVDDMFRQAAALEVVERRNRLLRALRDRGVLVADVAAAGLAGAVVNRYLEVKDRNLL